MQWDIRPFDGIGPLNFGMSPAAVGKVLDPMSAVTATRPVFDGTKNEFRTMGIPVVNYKNEIAYAFDTNPAVSNTIYDGMNLYKEKPRDVLSFLERKNGGAKYDLGMILFNNIGMNTTGFFFVDDGVFFKPGMGGQDGRGIALFESGAFDTLLPTFKDITFENR